MSKFQTVQFYVTKRGKPRVFKEKKLCRMKKNPTAKNNLSQATPPARSHDHDLVAIRLPSLNTQREGQITATSSVCHLTSPSHAENRHDDAAGMRGFAMLPEKKPLPGAKQQSPTLAHRQRFAGSRQRHFNVTGHIIRPFERVREKCIVLRHEPRQPSLKIAPRAGVGVFHHDERCARMLAKHMRDPARNLGSTHDGGDSLGKFLQTRAARGQHERLLINHTTDFAAARTARQAQKLSERRSAR